MYVARVVQSNHSQLTLIPRLLGVSYYLWFGQVLLEKHEKLLYHHDNVTMILLLLLLVKVRQ